MDYDKEEVGRKSFTYAGVKSVAKEVMNDAYFDSHPVKSISKKEAEIMLPKGGCDE